MTTYPMPQIHLNGSSAYSLEKQYMAALKAVDDAMEKMIQIDFHGRDYYVLDAPGDSGNAFDLARMKRNDHLEKLRRVLFYLEQHVVHIQKQMECGMCPSP